MSALDRLRVKRDLRVFVTAGAQGIGKVIALAFLDAGARVVVTDIDRDKLDDLAREHPSITCFVADAASADDLEQVEKFVDDEFGGLDVMVNNGACSLSLLVVVLLFGHGTFVGRQGHEVAVTPHLTFSKLLCAEYLASLLFKLIKNGP